MWIAIDAGTSVIKSVLFADDGRELALAREGTRILKPSPEASEQDMHEVWAAVVATVQSVLASAASDAATGGEPLRGLVSTAPADPPAKPFCGTMDAVQRWSNAGVSLA